MNRPIIKNLIIILTIAICFMLPFAQYTFASIGQQASVESGETGTEEDKKLVITVVEDIPAADIDDGKVPMANPAGGGATGSFIVLFPFIIILIAATGIIVILRVRYIRKQKELRAFIDAYDDNPDKADEE